jgi:tetratricopeptide (TPR) repeat protein
MPNCAEAFQILGRISLRKGSLQEAFINLRKAAVLMPKNSGILTDLGEALIKSKDYASAEKALTAVNKLNKKYAPAYYQLSLLCIDTGRIPEAKKALQKAKFYSRDDFELSLKIEQREAELNK